MTLHIGMTGTRNGMTQAQKAGFEYLLIQFKATHLHQGDCVGADKEAYDIATALKLITICHPPTNPKLRAWTSCNETRPKKGYFARNRAIVNESEGLIATPATDYETRGGTWYTIKYAIRTGKPVYVVHPNGKVLAYNLQNPNVC